MDGLPLMIVRVLVFLAGTVLVASTFLSAIRTFVLPRSAPDQISRSVFLVMRKMFDLRMRKVVSYDQRDGIMAMYAPMTLLVLPVVWLVLTAVGYTGVFWALRPLALRDTLLLSESSLLALGAVPISGLLTTSIVFGEATIGVLLTAILIAYLPTMYSAFSARETLVNMLEVRAGSPPSPATLFQRYGRIRGFGDLHSLWEEWELWFVQLEETHTSLAALSFFRSQNLNRSWITAAGVILDSAALAQSVVDVPDDYQAALTIRAGYLALRSIGEFFAIPYNPTPKADDPISVFRQEFDQLCIEMEQGGVPLKADRDKAWKDYCGWRVNYDTVLISLATLVMAPYAPWVSDRSLRWQRPGFLLRHKVASKPLARPNTTGQPPVSQPTVKKA